MIKEILNRRSVRNFKPTPLPEADILEIIKAGQLAPTARHNMATEFIVIKNQRTKEALFKLHPNKQEFLKEAPVLIIPVSDKTKSPLPIQDLSVATENMFLQATALGYGTVWKNLPPELEPAVKKLLHIPENFTLINIIPVGIPATKIEPHSEKEISLKKIHFEKW